MCSCYGPLMSCTAAAAWQLVQTGRDQTQHEAAVQLHDPRASAIRPRRRGESPKCRSPGAPGRFNGMRAASWIPFRLSAA